MQYQPTWQCGPICCLSAISLAGLDGMIRVAMRFRNLDFDTSQPMDEWPAEAIETVIDRGALSDWRQLARAIQRNPWGPAARAAETATSCGEHYGVDALIKRIIHKARENATSDNALPGPR